jgi:uncharacterized lipoprotein YmbA
MTGNVSPWRQAGALAVAGFVLLVLAGCDIAALGRQPPTQLYVLSTLEDTGGPPAAATPAAAGEVTIGVSTLSFPPYLERKEIVSRASDNRLVVEQFHKWGSAPDEEFSRALVADLRVLSPGQRILQPPYRAGFTPDYEIRVSVDRFERLANGTVVLDARWVVLRQPDGRPVASPSAQIRIADVANDVPAMVEAMSAAVIALARQMAGDLAGLPGRAGPGLARNVPQP